MEPNVLDPVYRQILDGTAGYRSIWWQQDFWRSAAANRVAVFQIQGFTDDLFPLTEAKRMHVALKAIDPLYPIASYFGDIGHPRASNKTGERDYVVVGAALRDLRGLSGVDPRDIDGVITVLGNGVLFSVLLHYKRIADRPRRRPRRAYLTPCARPQHSSARGLSFACALEGVASRSNAKCRSTTRGYNALVRSDTIKLRLAPLLLTRDTVVIPAHLDAWAVAEEVGRFFTGGHLRTVDATVAPVLCNDRSRRGGRRSL